MVVIYEPQNVFCLSCKGQNLTCFALGVHCLGCQDRQSLSIYEGQSHRFGFRSHPTHPNSIEIKNRCLQRGLKIPVVQLSVFARDSADFWTKTHTLWIPHPTKSLSSPWHEKNSFRNPKISLMCVLSNMSTDKSLQRVELFRSTHFLSGPVVSMMNFPFPHPSQELFQTLSRWNCPAGVVLFRAVCRPVLHRSMPHRLPIENGLGKKFMAGSEYSPLPRRASSDLGAIGWHFATSPRIVWDGHSPVYCRCC